MSQSSQTNKITILRLELREALGDKADKYFENMKNWFRMKISKEDFDYESRKLLPAHSSHLHNQFVLTLLQRCQALADKDNQVQSTPLILSLPSRPSSEHRARSSDQEKGGRKRARNRDRGAFEPVDITDYIPSAPTGPPPGPHNPLPSAPAPIPFEAFLPDASMLMGRFLLAGWDHGMDGAEDSAAQCLSNALQNFLKSVLSAVFQQRSGFRVRDNQFVYGIGNPVPNPWLKNTAHLDRALGKCRVLAWEEQRSRPTLEEAEQRAAYELACATSVTRGTKFQRKPPVSLFELYDALKLHRSVVKSHLVYNLIMEKITARLNHPGHEEISAMNLAVT